MGTEQQENTYEKYDENKLNVVIDSMRKRVKNLRSSAVVTIAFIGATMGGGFIAFYQAGEIVASENVNSFQKSITVNKSIDRLNQQLIRLGGSIDGSDVDLPEVQEKLDNIALSVDQIELKTAKISEAIPKEHENSSELNKKISIFSMITRVSAGIIMIFLIQVLVKLYRYNVRLATYYEARADALELAGNLSPDSIERTAKLLSPDSIDFGEMPEAPSKQLIDAVKQLGTSIKKK